MSTQTRPTADTLHRLYVGEGLSLAEVGNRIGYSVSGFAKLLNSVNIARRPPAASRTSSSESSIPSHTISCSVR